jgi:phosphoribosylglycinamide formyltransferase-1
LIDAAADPGFPAEIVLVLSNVAEAVGLDRAARAGIATAVISHKAHPNREAFDEAVRARIETSEARLVCLAGFMRLLGPGFIEAFRDGLINIHPSLLPAFPGLHVHERVLEAGVARTGCTVHFVRAETDAGPILIQAAVSVEPDDTPETLAARVLEQEHVIYTTAVRWIAEGRVTVDGERVRIDGEAVQLADSAVTRG